jgi:hypothetical protein
LENAERLRRKEIMEIWNAKVFFKSLKTDMQVLPHIFSFTHVIIISMRIVSHSIVQEEGRGRSQIVK